jgi:hypothetical protein
MGREIDKWNTINIHIRALVSVVVLLLYNVRPLHGKNYACLAGFHLSYAMHICRITSWSS